MGRARWLIVVPCAGVVACSLLVDLSGLDQNGDASDGAVADAADGGEASTGFCAKVDATFCDDFDDDAALAKWDLTKLGPPGALSVVTDASVSPPNCLVATYPAVFAQTDGVIATKHFGASTHIRAAFSIALDARDISAAAALVSVQVVPSPVGYTQYAVNISPVTTSIYLQTYWVPDDGGAPLQTSAPISLSLTSWRRLSLDVELGSKVAALYDDANNLLAQLPLLPITAPGFDVSIGLPTIGRGDGGGSWQSRFDDVVVFTP
jgi:hypothetical protein